MAQLLTDPVLKNLSIDMLNQRYMNHELLYHVGDISHEDRLEVFYTICRIPSSEAHVLIVYLAANNTVGHIAHVWLNHDAEPDQIHEAADLLWDNRGSLYAEAFRVWSNKNAKV